MTEGRANAVDDALPVVAHNALGSLAVIVCAVDLLLTTRHDLTDAEIEEDLRRIARHADRAAELLASLARDAADAAIDIDVRLAIREEDRQWAP